MAEQVLLPVALTVVRLDAKAISGRMERVIESVGVVTNDSCKSDKSIIWLGRVARASLNRL